MHLDSLVHELSNEPLLIWDVYDDDDMCTTSVEDIDMDVENCSSELEKQIKVSGPMASKFTESWPWSTTTHLHAEIDTDDSPVFQKDAAEILAHVFSVDGSEFTDKQQFEMAVPANVGFVVYFSTVCIDIGQAKELQYSDISFFVHAPKDPAWGFDRQYTCYVVPRCQNLQKHGYFGVPFTCSTRKGFLDDSVRSLSRLEAMDQQVCDATTCNDMGQKGISLCR